MSGPQGAAEPRTRAEAALAGRVVAVTGASRGIGRAVVERLAAAGATVIAGARSPMADAPPGVHAVVLDVTDERSVAAFADAAAAKGADSLVLNAGIGFFAAAEDTPPQVFRALFETNAMGAWLCGRAFVAHFRRRHAEGRSSRVVHVTSDISTRGFAGGSAYAASKAAQRAVAQSLAAEGQAYGLSVTEVRPGLTDTAFNGQTPGLPHAASHLRPGDVAEAVAWALAAPAHARLDEITLRPRVQPPAP